MTSIHPGDFYKILGTAQTEGVKYTSKSIGQALKGHMFRNLGAIGLDIRIWIAYTKCAPKQRRVPCLNLLLKSVAQVDSVEHYISRRKLAMNASIYGHGESIPSGFAIHLKNSARKALRNGLPCHVKRRAIEIVDSLARDPYGLGLESSCSGSARPRIKKECVREGFWRVRFLGSYRILYEIDSRARLVTIAWIGHHQHDYRKPRRLR